MKILDKLTRIRIALLHLLEYGPGGLFKFVSIETITVCNRRCAYCPNSKFDRGLAENKKFLKTELFYKLVDELSELEFSGIVSPCLYGEPLLDERLVQFMAYTRSKLPLAKICIFSNGDFLTVELYKSLLACGVNTFMITQHSEERSVNMGKVLEYRKIHGDEGASLSYDRIKNIVNRGGLIDCEFKKSRCRILLPEVAIDYNGDLILCCQDYFSSVKFGNLENDRLIDIWRKPNYRRLRKNIKKGVLELELCKKCKGS